MKKVEIITPQNVAIEYELAGLQLRIFASLIDYFCLFMLYISLVATSIAVLSRPPQWLLYVFLSFTVYTLVSEWWLNGQTLGKMAAGIKVVRLDGAPLQFSDSLTRWLLRVIDIFLSWGFLGMILISSSRWHQRLGDVIAHTVVIKVRTSAPPRLQDLLSFQDAGEYQPVYMPYLVFEQHEIILAKVTLDRMRRYKNEAHREALKMVADKIRKRINDPALEAVTDGNLVKGVITDYVMLTR
jgi:uncharacterized RDD family membrane protein YckC